MTEFELASLITNDFFFVPTPHPLHILFQNVAVMNTAVHSSPNITEVEGNQILSQKHYVFA